MFDPIATVELRRAARRGRHHHMRLLYVLALALEVGLLLLLCFSRANPLFGSAPSDTPLEDAGELLTDGLAWLVVQQFIVLLLAAPAFAAGAISDEKATGTLQYLLASPLAAREIIMGKWLS